MKIKYIFTVIFIIAFVFTAKYCMDNFMYDTKRDKRFTSPSGEITLTLRYDYVSRPFLFYKKKKIFADTGPGFSENAFFDIEWLSEQELRLYCEQFDEEYIISLDGL